MLETDVKYSQQMQEAVGSCVYRLLHDAYRNDMPIPNRPRRLGAAAAAAAVQERVTSGAAVLFNNKTLNP